MNKYNINKKKRPSTGHWGRRVEPYEGEQVSRPLVFVGVYDAIKTIKNLFKLIFRKIPSVYRFLSGKVFSGPLRPRVKCFLLLSNTVIINCKKKSRQVTAHFLTQNREHVAP